MTETLAFTALLMGVAGSPHCVVMCGAACATLSRTCRGSSVPHGELWAILCFLLGRMLSYSLAGALVAWSFSSLSQWAEHSAVLRPIWTLLHLAALALGLYLFWTGQQPTWFENFGRQMRRYFEHDSATMSSPISSSSTQVIQVFKGNASDLLPDSSAGSSQLAYSVKNPPTYSSSRVMTGGQGLFLQGWLNLSSLMRGIFKKGPLRAAGWGGLWAAWPCGLLQSALVVAALSNGPLEGAGVMASFALGSGLALGLGPWLWLKLSNSSHPWLKPQFAIRFAGLLVALASGWALGHGLWMQWKAFCS
jgi:uncharacterized protein